MSKPSQYGVKVSTWGTHVDAGNGILPFLDANLFGGSIGHAAVTMTLPADDPKTNEEQRQVAYAVAIIEVDEELSSLRVLEEVRHLKKQFKAVGNSLEKRRQELKSKLPSATPGKLYHLLHRHYKENQAELKIIEDLKSVLDNAISDYRSHLEPNGDKEILSKSQLLSLLESSVE